MNIPKVLNCFCELNRYNVEEFDGDLEDLCQVQTQKVLDELSWTMDDVFLASPLFADTFASYTALWEWKLICLSFHMLDLLSKEIYIFENILSTRDTRRLDLGIKHLITLGVMKNTQANLPLHVTVRCAFYDDPVYQYLILKCSILSACDTIKSSDMRMAIYFKWLTEIFVGIVQIAYGPLRKPVPISDNNPPGAFIMTADLYAKFREDQEKFRKVILEINQNPYYGCLIKVAMSLCNNEIPKWFRRAVSAVLTTILKSEKGVERVGQLMLVYERADHPRTWKDTDVMARLILSCVKSPDFKSNLFVQLDQAMELGDTRKDCQTLAFERFFVHCAKSLLEQDPQMCKELFLPRILEPLLRLANKSYRFEAEVDICPKLRQTFRMVELAFCFKGSHDYCFPFEELRPLINVVFRIHQLTLNVDFPKLHSESGKIVRDYIKHYGDQVDQFFDNILFGFPIPGVSQFRDDVVLTFTESELFVKPSDYSVVYSVKSDADALSKCLEVDQKVMLLSYLMKCITDKDRYFSVQNNQELLAAEENPMNVVLRRLMAVHMLLVQLVEDKEVRQLLRKKPDGVISYIKNVLIHSIEIDYHKKDYEKNQSLFTILMILDNLVTSSSNASLDNYKCLLEPLSVVAQETPNQEMKSLCQSITKLITREKEPDEAAEPITELSQALEDINSTLLPVRAHSFMMLAKLIRKKDPETMRRKQVLLNLFQVSLTETDSYIYLTVIDGLVAMTDLFPDTVLETLCDEFTAFGDKEERIKLETRLKLGEVLVRVTKSLGEMAVKYKAMLLNTFLVGARDHDHLIRASSLSNLGEVCRVLGYKLGTIVTEVLVCVHAIIATDKAVEARRAAVTVITQLFTGLESETISFLKDEILPIYRTLKDIYYDDDDKTMRLQAQLALEQLNENMRSFVFPKPLYHMEKKIVMLN